MIRNVVNELAQRLGMQLLVKREGEPETLFHFRLPAMRTWLDLDERLLATRAEAMLDMLQRDLHIAQRRLFRGVMDHIAKFDREPLDRIAKLEAAARALLDVIGTVGFHTGEATGNAVMNLEHAVMNLEQLLRCKPGAASFSKDGYGKDPR